MLYEVYTSYEVPCPLCERKRCGLSVVGNWVGKRGYLRWRAGYWADLIPYVRQLKLGNVLIGGWIIDPDVNGLLDDPCNMLRLITHYEEVVHTDVMNCGVCMVKDGGMGPKMFPEHLSNGSHRCPYVYPITFQYATLVPVDYSNFLHDVVHVIGGQGRFLIISLPLKWTWTPTLPQMSLMFLFKPLV